MDAAIKELLGYGLLGVVLFFIGYGLWVIIRWTGGEVVKPLKDRLVSFIDSMDKHQTHQGMAILNLTEMQRLQSEALKQMASNQTIILEEMKALHVMVSAVLSHLEVVPARTPVLRSVPAPGG